MLTLFSGLYLAGSIMNFRHRRTANDTVVPLAELVEWARPLEYALYFVLYAAAVPVVGYLPATVVFMVLMGRRVGYRKVRALVGLALLGVIVVLFFKTGLQVKMPAGVLYEWFPSDIRNFLIRHF